MNRAAKEILELAWVIAKVCVILGCADFSAYLFHEHNNIAYGVGLVLGVIFQLAIPPRKTWKKQVLVLTPIAVLIGLVHAFFLH